MGFLYGRPDESFMFGSVTGTVEATYDENWLVNGQPGYPVRGTTGLSLTVAALAARTVSLLSVINHNLTGSIAISGDASATIPVATFNADGIALNPWVAIDPVSASSLVLTVSQTPSIIGEFYAGTKRQLERQLLTEPDFDPGEPFEWEGDAGLVAPFDNGVDQRRLAGETLVSGTGMADIHAWWQSTRKGTRPTLIVPIDTINDAWFVTFRYRWRPVMITNAPATSLYKVQFQFVELPRVRW